MTLAKTRLQVSIAEQGPWGEGGKEGAAHAAEAGSRQYFGGIGAVLTTPIELAKTRLHASAHDRSAATRAN